MPRPLLFITNRLLKENKPPKQKFYKTKIAVCSIFTSEMNKIGSITESINRQYCKKQSYDFICEHQIIDKNRHPAWSKIILIQRIIDKYDWILWIDADAVFHNFDIPVKNFIDNNFDLIIGEDFKNHKIGRKINSGVLLFKKSLWSKNFLQEIYKYPANYYFNEQGAICDLINKNDNINHIKILEFGTINFITANGNWTKDTFIVHFAGKKREKNKLYQYMNKEFMADRI